MNALLRGTLTKSALPGGSSQILRARRQLQQDRRLREAKERRALASPAFELRCLEQKATDRDSNSPPDSKSQAIYQLDHEQSS